MRQELIGAILGGKYRITERIGGGGMGAVYGGTHVGFGRRIAIKVIHAEYASNPETVARMHREARAAGSMGHPNLCEVFDTGLLPDGSPYLVMERLEGETLLALLQRERRADALNVADWLAQVLSALSVVHAQGIIHRDIKPDNIFLVRRVGMDPLPKLLDFGISKMGSGSDETPHLTELGMVMGTPFYMAPEQARGDKIDHRIDLWAVGVVLYEAIAGVRPFAALDCSEVFRQILSDGYAPLSERGVFCPHALEAIVDRALQKDATRRYQTAIEFQVALQRVKKAAAKGAEDMTTIAKRKSAPAAATDEDVEATIVDPPAFLKV